MFDAKRLIGRTFDDNDVQKDIKHWPFKLVNKGGKPMIQVDHRGDMKDFVSVGKEEGERQADCNADTRGGLRDGLDEDEGDC